MAFCMSLCAKSNQDNNLPAGDSIQVVDANKPDNAEEAFQVIDKLPEFPGGQTALFKFIEENLQYPETAYKRRIEGRTICQFVVDTDGSLTDVKVLRSSGYTMLDKEALRVINSMPRWNPAIQKGKPTRANYTVPISFQLSDATKTTINYQDLLPAKKSTSQWKTGDEIRVRRDESNFLLTPDQNIASLNIGYTMATNGQIHGLISIVNDTMTVDYYDNDNLVKKESYRINQNGDILLEGNQYYYINGRVLCIDIIRKSILLGTTWFDENGNKDRSFVYSQGGVATQTLYYPSGKKMCVRDYLNNIVTNFDPNGNEATFEPSSLSKDFDRFTTFFNQALRYNYRMYTHEPFIACVTIDSQGRCSAWAYHKTDNQLIPINCANAPQWQPASINGTPVSSTTCLNVEYNPMEYATCNDTLPMRLVFQSFATYSGLRWINTRKYAATCADTCSLRGTVCKSGDSTIVQCFNPSTGELVCRQLYQKNDSGKNVLEGWSTYYANNKKDYEELAANDTIIRTIHYSGQETPTKVFVRKAGNAAPWDTMWTYYPTGEMKSLSVHLEKKDDNLITYFDKQGQPTQNVVLPVYSAGVKAINKYLKSNVPIRQSQLFQKKNWTSLECWADIYVEIDETGKVVHAGKGASSCTQNFKSYPLNSWEIEELYNLIAECLCQNPTLWVPGTINGEPTSLSTKIRVKYSCTNN